MALPRGAMRLSAVCDCGFPDHTHLLFLVINYKSARVNTAITESCVILKAWLTKS